MDNEGLNLIDEVFEVVTVDDAYETQSGMSVPSNVFENAKKEIKRLLKKGFIPKIYNGFIELAGKTFNGITESLLKDLGGK